MIRYFSNPFNFYFLQQCKVSIEMDQRSQTAKIHGGVINCEAAKQKIEEVTLQVIEDIELEDAM